MSKFSTYIFCLLLLLAASFSARAGFLVKKQTQSYPPFSAHAAASIGNSNTTAFHIHHAWLSPETCAITKDTRPGWKGIVSFCCSLFGLMGLILLGSIGIVVGFPVLAIIAGVVFGIMGLGKKNKFKGLAIAGLVIGILGLFFLTMVAVIASGF